MNDNGIQILIRPTEDRMTLQEALDKIGYPLDLMMAREWAGVDVNGQRYTLLVISVISDYEPIPGLVYYPPRVRL